MRRDGRVGVYDDKWKRCDEEREDLQDSKNDERVLHLVRIDSRRNRRRLFEEVGS